ncbi:histidine kinase [Limnochorda pilosa]|uniref:Histidine kinase n=1 Tax=Limnochorda pilosa TaxID=1555112 RepID=A0A0K2SLP9_LIMPI|nr:histidine kinase [Limnochorda pilosa]
MPAGVSESRLVPIRRELDVYLAIAQARDLARAMGFDAYATTEIETAVSELASNVLHHGVEGEAWLRRSGDRFEVACTDRGPGFAGTAGRPTAGLGVGLPGARRLMDGLTLEDAPAGGARVTAWRRLPPAKPRPGSPVPAGRTGREPLVPGPVGALEAAVALRSAEGESACGDAYAILPLADGVLVAVIDGVGHGPAAAEAAAQVVTALAELAAAKPGAALPEFLQAGHAASSSGRGAVAGLLRVRPAEASWAGVGNVRFHWVADTAQHGPEAGEGAHGQPGGFRMGAPGCLGVRWPDPAPREEAIPGGGIVLMATDGVPFDVLPEAIALPSAGADPSIPEPSGSALREPVEAMVAGAGGRDDALVLAVRLRTPPIAPAHALDTKALHPPR